MHFSPSPELFDFISRFEQECQILRDLKHPNIVQFLGVVQDPTTNKPIILMELIKHCFSLTSFLPTSEYDIPYHVQVNIFHDIALAVAHLHRNDILHRDLSSNNILLSASHQAKVTDFGMSKIADLEPSMSQSRKLGFMPPEALCPHPRYSEKVDIFSVGVLLLQIATRNPNPAYSARMRTMTDPNVLNPKVKSEFESRKSYIY